jgi:hypothetical protein
VYCGNYGSGYSLWVWWLWCSSLTWAKEPNTAVRTLQRSQAWPVRDEDSSFFLTAFENSSGCSDFGCFAGGPLGSSDAIRFGGIVMASTRGLYRRSDRDEQGGGSRQWKMPGETPGRRTHWTQRKSFCTDVSGRDSLVCSYAAHSERRHIGTQTGGGRLVATWTGGHRERDINNTSRELLGLLRGIWTHQRCKGR